MVSAPPRRLADQTRRIRDLLRASIIAEDFKSGMLPSEEDLRIEFAAPRSCVRDALNLLQDEGLVTRVRGQGTFVSSGRIWTSLREMHGTDDPADGSIWSGRLRSQIVDWSDVVASPPVARALDLTAGESVLRVDYVAFCDDVPMGQATNHITYPEAEELRPEMLRIDFYSMLHQGGIEVGESTFRIDSALADEHDAELLGMRIGDPVLVLEQVIYSADGRPIDVAYCRSSATRTTLFSRFSRNGRSARTTAEPRR